MPFKSEAQQRYFNANRTELEAKGVDVDEWNKSSKGKDLPEKKKKNVKKAAAVLYHVLVLNNLKHAQMMQPLAEPTPPQTPPLGNVNPAPAVDTTTPPTKAPATMTPGTLTPGASRPTRAPQIASTT